MRYLSFLVISVLFFPSLSFGISYTCDYLKSEVIPVTYTGDHEGSYSYYDTADEASFACVSSRGAACAYIASPTQYNYWDSDVYNRFFVCTDCDDTCPMDNTCDDQQCEAHAACDCTNKGPVSINDLNTCDYTCGCQDQHDEAQADCSIPVLLTNEETCEYACNDCPEAMAACETCECGGQPVGCEGGGLAMCVCTNCPDDPEGSAVDPTEDPDDDPDGDSGPSNPPGGDDPGDGAEPYDGDPDTGASPDPDSPADPDNDPATCKTCDDVQVETCTTGGCIWSCVNDSNGCYKSGNCDCHADPTGDDGANGWIAATEENTDRSANEAEKNNEWNKAIKHNSDEQLEDSDNIADNTRKGVQNNKGYFAEGDGGSVFKKEGAEDGGSVFKEGDGDSAFTDGKDSGSVFKDGSGSSAFTDGDGNSYLKQIADNTAGGSGDGDTEGDSDITTEGSGTAPSDNSYDTSLTGEGFTPVEDTFSQDLSNYIATGIPLVSWLNNSTINLSSASATLSFSFWGYSVGIDFSQYQSIIDLAGNLLFYLTIFTSFMMIITRIKY